MMFKDLTNKKFNNLTAIKCIERTPTKWLFKCDCGNEKIIRSDVVISGKVKSCGCQTKNRWEIDRKISKNNSVGCCGVYFDEHFKKYRAYFMYKKKQYFSMRYENIEDAIKWRKSVENKLKTLPTQEELKEFLMFLKKREKYKYIRDGVWEKGNK